MKYLNNFYFILFWNWERIKTYCCFRMNHPQFWTAVSKPLFLSRDEDSVQVLSLSDQRLVVLEVTVTNMPSDPLNPFEDGDDAHAAQLVITLPPTLSYAGSRIPPQVWDFFEMNDRNLKLVCVSDCVDAVCPKTPDCLQMRCQANTNGSQVECDLGNPMKRDTKVRKEATWGQSRLRGWRLVMVFNHCFHDLLLFFSHCFIFWVTFCLYSIHSPSTWAQLTSPLRPLSWQQASP